MTVNKVVEAPPNGWRFRVGIGFFVLGWILPLMIPFVTASDIPTEWKTTISGLLLVGGPEIFSFVSIGFLGKDGLTSSSRECSPSSSVPRLAPGSAGPAIALDWSSGRCLPSLD